MGRVFLDMALSLDGFVAGPKGEDGGLHDWYFAPSGDAERVKAELLERIGAMIVGRRAFGREPDGFDTPYKVPHLVLTHEAREPVSRAGARFLFVTAGLERALEEAKAAAGDKDVCIAGGAQTAQQYLAAGLIDEVQLHLVPVLFGGGLRLFGALPEKVLLQKTRTLESGGVTHLRFSLLRER